MLSAPPMIPKKDFGSPLKDCYIAQLIPIILISRFQVVDSTNTENKDFELDL
jgi:hypothetical protein